MGNKRQELNIPLAISAIDEKMGEEIIGQTPMAVRNNIFTESMGIFPPPVKNISRKISNHHYNLYAIAQMLSSDITIESLKNEQRKIFLEDSKYFEEIPRTLVIKENKLMPYGSEFKEIIENIYYKGKTVFNKLAYNENFLYAFRTTYLLKSYWKDLKQQLEEIVIEDVAIIRSILEEFIKLAEKAKTKELPILWKKTESEIIHSICVENYKNIKEENHDQDTNEYRIFFYQDIVFELSSKEKDLNYIIL